MPKFPMEGHVIIPLVSVVSHLTDVFVVMVSVNNVVDNMSGINCFYIHRVHYSYVNDSMNIAIIAGRWYPSEIE